MDILVTVPALVKTLCVFGVILVLNRLWAPLSFSLLMGSVVLGFWMEISLPAMAWSALHSLTRPQTIGLMLIVGAILVMSRLMKDSGHMDRIVHSFGRLSRDSRTTSALMPALFGLLPMPGGALFSAPLVETAFANHTVAGDRMTAVNYWFRHIWEYWWPLYPGVALAVALLQVDTWQFIGIMAPMTLITVMAGVFFILRPLGKMPVLEAAPVSWSGIREFLWEVMPILIVIFMILLLAGLKGLLALMGIGVKITGAFPIFPGLVAATIWVYLANHISPGQLGSAFTSKEIRPMLLLIAAIMVFKGIMTDSQAVFRIREELGAYDVPVVAVVFFMPFLSGVITGIAIGFVGTAFPLIIPLFSGMPLFDYLSYAALGYTAGYMGMMLSPVHLCFLATKDYFRARLLRCYRCLLLPALTVMLTATVLFLVSRAL